MPSNPISGQKVVIYGLESTYFSDMAESLGRLGCDIVAGIVASEPLVALAPVQTVITPEEVSRKLLEHPVIPVAMVPGQRKQKFEAVVKLGFKQFKTVVDPTSVASLSATFDIGCYINVCSAIASHVELARFVYVGRQSSLGHHTRLEEFCTIGPGVTVASHCHLGRGVMVGAGATIAPELAIGPNSVIGAGATVVRDVPGNTIVAGNPARKIREGITGYRDYSV